MLNRIRKPIVGALRKPKEHAAIAERLALHLNRPVVGGLYDQSPELSHQDRCVVGSIRCLVEPSSETTNVQKGRYYSSGDRLERQANVGKWPIWLQQLVEVNWMDFDAHVLRKQVEPCDKVAGAASQVSVTVVAPFCIFKADADSSRNDEFVSFAHGAIKVRFDVAELFNSLPARKVLDPPRVACIKPVIKCASFAVFKSLPDPFGSIRHFASHFVSSHTDPPSYKVAGCKTHSDT